MNIQEYMPFLEAMKSIEGINQKKKSHHHSLLFSKIKIIREKFLGHLQEFVLGTRDNYVSSTSLELGRGVPANFFCK